MQLYVMNLHCKHILKANRRLGRDRERRERRKRVKREKRERKEREKREGKEREVYHYQLQYVNKQMGVVLVASSVLVGTR